MFRSARNRLQMCIRDSLNPVENQAIFPDTHERIIDDDVFEKVQEIRSQRHRMTRTGKMCIRDRLYRVRFGQIAAYVYTEDGYARTQ